MTRSGFGISAIFASRSLSPASLVSAALSSRARSFIAAFSSAVNPLVEPARFVVAGFVAVLFSAITSSSSGELLDADQVARRVAEGAVADPIRLVGRFLDDLGVAGLQPLECA